MRFLASILPDISQVPSILSQSSPVIKVGYLNNILELLNLLPFGQHIFSTPQNLIFSGSISLQQSEANSQVSPLEHTSRVTCTVSACSCCPCWLPGNAICSNSFLFHSSVMYNRNKISPAKIGSKKLSL